MSIYGRNGAKQIVTAHTTQLTRRMLEARRWRRARCGIAERRRRQIVVAAAVLAGHSRTGRACVGTAALVMRPSGGRRGGGGSRFAVRG